MAVLGGVIRAASVLVQGEGGGIEASVKRLSELTPDMLEKQILGGAAAGFKELQALYANSIKQTKQLLG